jgi:hypothetical protein
MASKYLTNEDPILVSINTDVTDLQAALDAHIADNTNPHGATLQQTDIEVSGTLKANTILPHTPLGDISLGNSAVKIRSDGFIVCGEFAEPSFNYGFNFYGPFRVWGADGIMTGALSFDPTPDVDNTGVPIAVDGDGNVVTRNDLVNTTMSQTLTNKTINSANNTLQVNGTNINSLIDQDLRTTSTPTFADISADEVSTNLITAQTGNTVSIINSATFSVNSTTGQMTCFIVNANNLILTSVSLDNSKDQILVRDSSSGTIFYRNNITDASNSQTLTNKTINSANNTLQVNGTNINSLVNQDVRTTSNPSFANILTTSTSADDIKMANVVKDRKLVLYDGASGGKSFYGLGVQGNQLRVQVDQPITDVVFYAATSSTTEQEIFRVKGTGGVQFPNSTSGYTPTNLNYYENTTFDVQFTGAATINVTVRVVRIGNKATLFIPEFIGTYASTTTLSVAASSIPARFRPSANTAFRVTTINNSSHDEIPGWFTILSNGGMLLERRASGVVNFTAGSIGKVLTTSHEIYVN